MTEKNKIGFDELTTSLKILTILGWILVACTVYYVMFPVY